MVLLVYVGNGQDRDGLLVNDTSESRLALNDNIRDVLLPAQSGQPQYELV